MPVKAAVRRIARRNGRLRQFDSLAFQFAFIQEMTEMRIETRRRSVQEFRSPISCKNGRPPDVESILEPLEGASDYSNPGPDLPHAPVPLVIFRLETSPESCFP